MIILADVETLEQLLKGSAGFVLGVVFCVFIYVKWILPRHDRNTAATERIADAMNAIALQMKEIVEQQKLERQESFDEILKRLPER